MEEQKSGDVEKMKEKIKDEIEKVLRKNRLTLKSAILFGSRAIESHFSGSDWDILIVLKENIYSFEKIRIRYEIYRALHKKFRKSSFDVFVKSEQEFNEEASVMNTISNEAAREGVML